jgi:hypothetical protein
MSQFKRREIVARITITDTSGAELLNYNFEGNTYWHNFQIKVSNDRADNELYLEVCQDFNSIRIFRDKTVPNDDYDGKISDSIVVKLFDDKSVFASVFEHYMPKYEVYDMKAEVKLLTSSCRKALSALTGLLFKANFGDTKLYAEEVVNELGEVLTSKNVRK